MISHLEFIDANPGDAQLLSETCVISKKIWGYPDELIKLWRTDLEVTSEYILKNKVVKILDNKIFVGFFALKTENYQTELDHLWLLPEYIKRNYGRKIFEHVLSFLFAKGIKKMKLLAEPNAKGFYDKMGGTVVMQVQSKISGRLLDVYQYQIASPDIDSQ